MYSEIKLLIGQDKTELVTPDFLKIKSHHAYTHVIVCGNLVKQVFFLFIN